MQNKNPLVSIIIPVFNGEEYLTQCLDSIQNQTYGNLEIVVVDDGSSDKSLDIAKSHARKDKRLKIVSQDNRGVSSARNAGLTIACGEYVSFVDDDDAAMPWMIEHLVSVATKNSLDIACAQLFVRERHTRMVGEKLSIMTSKDAVRNLLYMKQVVTGPYCKLVKASIAKGVQFEPYTYGEDLAFNIDILLRARSIAVSDKLVYRYRRNSTSAIGAAFSKKRMDIFRALEHVRHKYIHGEPNLLRAWAFRYYMAEPYLILCKLIRCRAHKKYSGIYKTCKLNMRKHSKMLFVDSDIPTRQRIQYLVALVSPKLSVVLVDIFDKMMSAVQEMGQ